MEQQEFFDKLVSFYTSQFEKASNYTNIIIGGGYVAYFTVWGNIKDLLSDFDRAFSAIFICISLALYIAWEIIKMLSNSLTVKLISKAMQQKPDEAFEHLKKADKAGFKIMSLWLWFLIPTVVFGFAGVYFLIPSLIRVILHH